MITSTRGLTLTTIRQLIHHAIDETIVASTDSPHPADFVERITLMLYTRLPRHHRLHILRQQVRWEEEFGKTHSDGVPLS